MTTFYRRMRRARATWLDRAATADQVVGYALVAAFACSVFVLIVEAVR